MMAVIDMIRPLEQDDFRIWKQTRTGLLSHPLDPDLARGHLAASIYLQMALQPHIIHIVGHTEAHHAATADDIIEASKIARRVVENAVRGAPDMSADPAISRRRKQLIGEAKMLLEAIVALAGPDIDDPLTDPQTLARAVTCGLMDAPQLRNNKFGRGQVRTMIFKGSSVAVDPKGKILEEHKRLAELV